MIKVSQKHHVNSIDSEGYKFGILYISTIIFIVLSRALRPKLMTVK